MKNVLIATLAAFAVLSAGAAFADDAQDQLLTENSPVTSEVSSTFDGFAKDNSDFTVSQIHGRLLQKNEN